MRVQSVLVVLVALFAANLAFGGPILPCNSNTPNPGFTCNLYDTTNNLAPGSGGSFTDTPPIITNLPPVSGSVLTEWWAVCAVPGSCTSAPATWSDLVEIVSNGTSSTVQLWSRGCNTANPLDVSCYPSAVPPPTYITETAPETTFRDGPGSNDVFNIFESSAPEPATLPLIGGGLAALGFFARRRANKA